MLSREQERNAMNNIPMTWVVELHQEAPGRWFFMAVKYDQSGEGDPVFFYQSDACFSTLVWAAREAESWLEENG
jgi:hypothetical protein